MTRIAPLVLLSVHHKQEEVFMESFLSIYTVGFRKN